MQPLMKILDADVYSFIAVPALEEHPSGHFVPPSSAPSACTDDALAGVWLFSQETLPNLSKAVQCSDCA